jgi:hypothetical protein
VKIYLAAIYHGGFSTPGSSKIDLRMTERLRYPYVLESFAYADAPMVMAIRHNNQRIFLDSGAYTVSA